MALSPRTFEDRPNQIGGSEVAAILGIDPFKSAASLLVEKRTGQRPADEKRLRIMETGSHMEPQVMEFYRQAHPTREYVDWEQQAEYHLSGPSGAPAVVVSHPDATFVEVNRALGTKKRRLLEIKTTTGWRRDVSMSVVADSYLAQVQMEMHGANQTGAPVNETDIVVYNLSNGDLYEHRVVYDREWCEQALAQVEDFRDNYLFSPRPTVELALELAADTEDVQQLMGISAEDGKTKSVADDPAECRETVAMIKRLVVANERAQAAGVEKAQAENAIKNLMGENLLLNVYGERIARYGNVRGRSTPGPVTEFEQRLCSADVIGSIARQVADLLPDGVGPVTVATALSPVLSKTAKGLSSKIIEDLRGKPYRRFAPNYERMRDLVDTVESVERTGARPSKEPAHAS